MLSNITNKMTDIEFSDYKSALSNEAEFYIARDVNEKGVKQYASCSYKQLRPYLDDNYNLYEILKEDKPRKVYFDFDCKFNSVRNWAEQKTEEENHAEIVSIIVGMFESFLEEFQLGELPKYTILNSSDNLKYSFHFCFDLALKNHIDSLVFHKKFLEFCKLTYEDDEDHKNLYKYIDPNVYTKNRLIRLINQSKFGQDRILKIFTEDNFNYPDYIISYINDKTKFIDIPTVWKTRFNNRRSKVNKVKTLSVQDYNENDELLWLVKHTLHKAIEYTDWIKWVWACVSAGVPTEIIHIESYSAEPEKYDEHSVNKIILQYDDDKNYYLGKNSLISWAAEMGRYLDREVEKKAIKLSQDRDQHLHWIDFQKKYHNKVFESENHMFDSITGDLSQVVSYVQLGKPVFVVYINDENPFDITNGLNRLYLKYKEEETTIFNGKMVTNETIKKVRLLSLIIDNPLKFPLYNKIVFKPYDYGLKKHERNTFSGFQAQYRSWYDSEYIQPILFHIKNVLADGDNDIYLYIMSWLWRIINKPYNKTGIFMLFYGQQGTGKTIFADFLIEHVFGKNLSFSTNGIKPLTQRFNGCTMSKLFCCCNELSTISDSGNNWHAGFDSMKNLITDKLISVEKKGMEHIMVDNHINFMGTTNNPNCIKVENGDRRYACFEVSNKYKGDYDYFDRLGACMNKEGGNHFYNYMISCPKDKLVDIRKIPKTRLRSNLLENSKSQFDRFIDDFLLSEDYSMDERKWISKEDKEISKKDLYTEYQYWCGENNETVKSSNVFFRNISKDRLAFDLSTNPRKMVNGVTIPYVKFN